MSSEDEYFEIESQEDIQRKIQSSLDFNQGYKAAKIPTAKELLDKMTDEQRLEVLRNYCHYCGSDNPNCQCWNDE